MIFRRRDHRQGAGPPRTRTDLTYPQDLVGASAAGADLAGHPRVADGLTSGGFHVLHHSATIGHGQLDHDRAVMNLMSGRAHRLAGAPLHRLQSPLSGESLLHAGDLVTVTPGRGLLTPLESPCLVLVADSTQMIYGTLPGHVECGEERFAVTLGTDGTVTATVTAFSRPGRWFTAVAGPVGRCIQSKMAEAYVRGMGAPQRTR